MNQDEKIKCADCLKEIESVEDLTILIHADSIQEIQFCRNCAEKALKTGEYILVPQVWRQK
jgi:hypothetical protein